MSCKIDPTPIKVLIEFSLEQPVGGVQFVQTTPDNSVNYIHSIVLCLTSCFHSYSYSLILMSILMVGSIPLGQFNHHFSDSCFHGNRLWFPCVDSYNELCHWSLSYTIPVSMIAISCGDLGDQVRT